MATKNATEYVLQIPNLPPHIVKQVKQYELDHDLNHTELFIKALQVLLAQDALEA